MSTEAESVQPRKSSRLRIPWKTFQILVIPLTTWIVGQYASRWQERESARRIYADMMSRREDAESALRKDMFQTTVQPFIEKKTDDLDASVLRLELLASNFHESLDFSPLFKDVYRRLSATHTPNSNELLQRLTTTAQDVISREIEAVREAGTLRTASIPLDDLKQGPVFLFSDQVLTLPGDHGPARTFRVQVIEHDPTTNEFLVRLTVWRPGQPPTMELETKPFHVGPFDFPLIDNTRLTGGQRLALALNAGMGDMPELVLLYFPGSRASLKDKQYYEDMASELLRIEQRNRENAQP